jgi:hypothetical protein
MSMAQAMRGLIRSALSCTNKYNLNAQACFVKEVVPEGSGSGPDSGSAILGKGLEMTGEEGVPRGALGRKELVAEVTPNQGGQAN